MAVIHRANRKLRKEVVIPFEGEHNFIVPQYVNAAGKAPIALDEPLVPQAPTSGTYSSSSTSVTSAPVSTPAPIVAVQTTTPVTIASPITSTKPIESTRPIDTQATTTAYNASNYFPVKDYASMSCNAITSYLSELNNVETTSWDGVNAARAQGEYNSLVTSVRNAMDSACRVIETKNDVLEFPSIIIMDCTQLTAEIARLQSMGNAANLPANTKAQYDAQILSAQNLYNSKSCNVVTPPITSGTESQVNTSTSAVSTPTEVTSTTTVTPPFSPILGGGGGGGGLGAEPSSTNTEKEITKTVKKDNSWLWILLLVGGIYFLTKKKK